MKKLNLGEKFEILEDVLETIIDNQYDSEDDYEMTVINIEGDYSFNSALYVNVIEKNSDVGILFSITQYGRSEKKYKKVYVRTMREDSELEIDIEYSDKDELLEKICKANKIIFNNDKALFLEKIFAEKFSRCLRNDYINRFDKNIDNYDVWMEREYYDYDKENNEIKLCLECLFKDAYNKPIERRLVLITVKAYEDGKIDLVYIDKYKKKEETLKLDKDSLCMLINSYIQN